MNITLQLRVVLISSLLAISTCIINIIMIILLIYYPRITDYNIMEDDHDYYMKNTVVSERLTEEAFSSIKKGQDIYNVISNLGEPQNKLLYSDNITIYYFSKPINAKKDYVTYFVEVSKSGKVLRATSGITD